MHHLHHLSYVNEYLRSFGYLAPLVALFLFIIQAVFPIFPYAILVAAAVILFGVKIGFVVSLLGAVLGSILCYWACRELGADWFNHKILGRWGYDTRNVNANIAFGGIVIAHMIPVLPGAMITLAAAVSRVSFGNFVASTALGLVPTTLAYSGLGMLLHNVQDPRKILLILALGGLILFMGKDVVKRRLNSRDKFPDP